MYVRHGNVLYLGFGVEMIANCSNCYSTPPGLFVAVPIYARRMACVVMGI